MARADDYYQLLGVEPDASDEQIRKAFRERVRACHPDRVATLDEELRLLAEEKMVALNEAYAVLRSSSRRTAYDERLRAAAEGSTTASGAGEGSIAAHRTAERTDDQRNDATGRRSRIGEHRFITRAASEEFEQTVRRCVAGQVAWAPADVPGTTLTLHGRRGRSNLYFALRAESHLDPRDAQHFFHALRTFGSTLGKGLFGRSRLFGFAAAVTFGEQPRQRRALDRFNRATDVGGPLQPATFIDLANWHVIPGETSLQQRLEELLRAA